MAIKSLSLMNMIPNMSKNITLGHIVSKLVQQSFLSAVKLCDAGCSVIFEHDCFIVIHNGNVLCTVKNVRKWDCGWYYCIWKKSVINLHTPSQHKTSIIFIIVPTNQILYNIFIDTFPPKKSTIIKLKTTNY